MAIKCAHMYSSLYVLLVEQSKVNCDPSFDVAINAAPYCSNTTSELVKALDIFYGQTNSLNIFWI